MVIIIYVLLAYLYFVHSLTNIPLLFVSLQVDRNMAETVEMFPGKTMEKTFIVI